MENKDVVAEEQMASPERTFESTMEVFRRHDMSFPIFYYDPETKEVYKGSNILPHEEDHNLVNHLIYIGTEKNYATYKKWGVDEFYSRGGRSNVASVGRNSKTGEWFGWSHRGYGKFAVGYVVKEGSMLSNRIAGGYSPKTEEHCRLLAEVFADLLD